MSVSGFREAFRGGREANEGFYAFQNHMSFESPEFTEIVRHLDLLARQFAFILQTYSFDDEKLFGLLKRLEIILLSLQHAKPGYDESKPLCGFIYEIFAGWSFASGYRDYDLIEKAIADM